jgi:4-hydroxy-tetrahydrodipicolinate synthase
VCVCGTTGEASTLSDEEQLSVIAHAIRYCAGKIKVIAGTGSNNTKHAITLSRIADSMGADALLVVTPYYNKTNTSGLIEHYTLVADAVNTPVILYNVPSRTGVDIPLEAYLALSQHSNIAGVKEASGNIKKVNQILANCGENFHVWCGNDDEIVAQMSLGATGAVSVLSNLFPAETLAMVRNCQNGEIAVAAKMQQQYLPITDALFSDVNPIPIKDAMNLCGFDIGVPRLPLTTLSTEKRQHLEHAIKCIRP